MKTFLDREAKEEKSICLHSKTRSGPWPDGGAIDICINCGMSRYIWEHGQTDWIMIEDIPKVRKEVEAKLEEIRENIKFEEGGQIGTDSGLINKWKGEKV
jgi:hypothetical protein